MGLTRGSVTDLARMYIKNVAVTKLSETQIPVLVAWINRILDSGYTFNDIKSEMIHASRTNSDVRWKNFSKPKPFSNDVNLLKTGNRYYHKELVIKSGTTVVDHDIDNGTLVSHTEDFYIEPSASYTMNDFLNYFYEKIHPDKVQFNPKRLSGFFNSMLNSFPIDILLFMIEAIAQDEEKCGNAFTFNGINDYSVTAQRYINDIKQNCAQFGGDGYVYRKLMPDM